MKLPTFFHFFSRKLFLVMFVVPTILIADSALREVCAESASSMQQKTETIFLFKADDEIIELEEKVFLDEKISLLIPTSFEQMPEEEVAEKYHYTYRPPFVLTNKDANINIIFNHTRLTLSEAGVKEFKDTIVRMFKNARHSLEWQWLNDEVKSVNNKNIGVLEFISQRNDTKMKIYNKILLLELDGKALIIIFNCTETQMNDWKPIAAAILNSIKENEGPGKEL